MHWLVEQIEECWRELDECSRSEQKLLFLYPACNQTTDFLPPDILWVVEVYTGQIRREKHIEDYCSDITLRSVLASGSGQDKTTT